MNVGELRVYSFFFLEKVFRIHEALYYEQLHPFFFTDIRSVVLFIKIGLWILVVLLFLIAILWQGLLEVSKIWLDLSSCK